VQGRRSRGLWARQSQPRDARPDSQQACRSLSAGRAYRVEDEDVAARGCSNHGVLVRSEACPERLLDNAHVGEALRHLSREIVARRVVEHHDFDGASRHPAQATPGNPESTQAARRGRSRPSTMTFLADRRSASRASLALDRRSTRRYAQTSLPVNSKDRGVARSPPAPAVRIGVTR
jgi:hypothetical protein